MQAHTPKLVLVLSVPVLLAALFLFWHQRAGPLEAPVVATVVPAVEPTSDAPRDSTDLSSAELTSPEQIVLGQSEERPGRVPEVDPRLALEILKGIEGDSGTGVILGGIFDSTGVRIGQGRVLVFAGRNGSDLVETLELEFAHWEYRVELTAGRDYWLQVDPESLHGDLLPTIGQAYVSLERDAEVRMDLEVGRPASVVGRLVSAVGRGVPGATARLIGQDQNLLGFSQEGVTDAAGYFSIARVFPGNYRLRFFRGADWVAPHPVELQVEAKRPNDVGDIRVEAGRRLIRGSVANQDGQPFGGLEVLCYSTQVVGDGVPSHGMGSVLGRATTDEYGVFELGKLPAIQVKLSLTPNFNPNSILGPGRPAIWEPFLEFDLETSGAVLEAGAYTVEESRPFEISGQLQFDPDWLKQCGNQASDLSATVSFAKGQAMPEGVRRVSLRRKSVDLDFEKGAFRCLVETPRPELELRFHLRGQKDLVFTVQPEALHVWSKDVRVPGDFH